MKAFILTLFSFSFVFNTYAYNVPAFAGKIENLSHLATDSLEIDIYARCKLGDTTCGRVNKSFRVTKNGEFKTTSFRIPNSSWPLGTFTYTVVVKGENLYWELPTKDDVRFYPLSLFEIPEQTLTFSLKDGGDASAWMKEALPESKLDFRLALKGADLFDLGYEIINSYNMSMTTPELKVQKQFVIVNKEKMISNPLTLSLQYKTTLGKTIFNYTERVNSLDAILSSVEHVVVDGSLAIDSIHGSYSGTLLLHELGPLIEMAIANSRLNLNLACTNGVLSGEYENFWKKENSDVYDVLASKGMIQGTCTDFGKGEFTLDLPLKEYLGETIITRKLNFKISGVNDRKVQLRVQDDLLQKDAGYLAQY